MRLMGCKHPRTKYPGSALYFVFQPQRRGGGEEGAEEGKRQTVCLCFADSHWRIKSRLRPWAWATHVKYPSVGFPGEDV